ncbi:hypothetical protein LIG30_2066 [Burkholderia sp. lig30]|nr:hypothetical protein LIG30_2066 [Burkholderia sp. lig30]
MLNLACVGYVPCNLAMCLLDLLLEMSGCFKGARAVKIRPRGGGLSDDVLSKYPPNPSDRSRNGTQTTTLFSQRRGTRKHGQGSAGTRRGDLGIESADQPSRRRTVHASAATHLGRRRSDRRRFGVLASGATRAASHRRCRARCTLSPSVGPCQRRHGAEHGERARCRIHAGHALALSRCAAAHGRKSLRLSCVHAERASDRSRRAVQ